MSEQQVTGPISNEQPPWQFMTPGDQAVYMPCTEPETCPNPSPSHYHLDHIMHQEP